MSLVRAQQGEPSETLENTTFSRVFHFQKHGRFGAAESQNSPNAKNLDFIGVFRIFGYGFGGRIGGFSQGEIRRFFQEGYEQGRHGL